MVQNYQNSMAIVRDRGKPDGFLTMTCNPYWKEIVENLSPGREPRHCPWLCARVFHAKFQELLDDLLRKEVLGKVKAYSWVIEFQKRGLPHAHLLLILENGPK